MLKVLMMFIKREEKAIILIACVGTSPAVLTETVWALAHESIPAIPERVVVITTSTGRDRVVSELLTGENSVWSQMNMALFKDPHRIKLGTTDIRVIPDANNNEVDDLRSADDNMRAVRHFLRSCADCSARAFIPTSSAENGNTAICLCWPALADCVR